MLNYTVTMPRIHIENAQAICKLLREAMKEYDEQMAEARNVDPIRDGLAARDRALQRQADIATQMAQTKAEAVEQITKLRTMYIDELSRQTSINGHDTNEDYNILRDGLVDDPRQLRMMAERNPDNYTVFKAIERYAREKGWEGFETIGNAPKMESFGQNWFDLAVMACGNPSGLAMMQITDEGELQRMMTAYDVL